MDNTASRGHSHDHGTHLLRVGKLALHAQGVSLVTDVEGTTRDIAVLSTDKCGNGFNAQLIGLHAQGIQIDVDFTLGCTGNRYRTHTVNASQRIGNVLIQDLIQSRHALSGLNREQHDGDHVAAELEDDGRVGIVGQHARHHVEFVAHIVGQRLDVVAVFKLKGYNRDVLTAV